MDPLEELERMVLNARTKRDAGDEPTTEDVARWQRLFGYSHTEAINLVKEHRANFSRQRVTEEHWNLVRPAAKKDGYDREAYEYSLSVHGRSAHEESQADDGDDTAIFVFKLGGPLVKAECIREIGKLSQVPRILDGSGEEGDAQFCRVDGKTKREIEGWLRSQYQGEYSPTFVRLSQAKKELSSTTAYPTLGVDTTLPQHRACNGDDTFLPKQDQYPVWYFFYGTLGDPEMLCRLLALDAPSLRTATICGGVIKTWCGKYKALVDASTTSLVVGWAFQVTSWEYEDALLAYETAAYEVVRCRIVMQSDGSVVGGCTFRFVDPTLLD